jgi:hypothetical protein
VQERAEGLQKIATTDHTQQLPPGTPTGMAIGAEIAPTHPAPIGTIWVRAEVHRGIDVAAAPPCERDARGRSGRSLRVGIGGVLTGAAGRLGGEARKEFRRTVVLGPWGWGGQGCRARGGVARPRPLEHNAQSYECNQCELVEEQMRYHGKTPSYTC